MKSIELNNRDNSLNLIRLILASFVLIYPSYILLGVKINIPHPLLHILILAVPCFFVISGYLIVASAIKNNFSTFLKKRFGRIFPAYLFSIVSTIILFAPITFTLNHGGTFDFIIYVHDSNIISYFLQALPFRSNILTLGTTLVNLPADNWNGSAWTLQYEFGCYISLL